MSVIGKGQISGHKSLLLLISVVALVFSTAYLVTPLVPKALGAATVTIEDGIEGCMGVRTTPGSENTTKELVGGTLEPGGTATFRFTFPATAGGSPGQEEWKLTDCVFINDEPVLKYTVTALENDVSPVIIEFTLTIPGDVPIGAEYCNYAKTTETPSDAQASNRKAGPACFIVGGAMRVTKVDSAAGPLAGATFTVECNWPDVSPGTFLPDTILSVPTDGTIGADGSTETIDSTDDGAFARTVVTGDEGVISINGPEATECTVTETAAPDGYILPDASDCTVVIASGEQGVCEFVNELAATPSPSEEQSVAESVVASASGEQSVEAGTGTPEESQADTANALFGGGPLPTVAFSLVLLASLAALAYANVMSVRRRS